MNKNQIRHNITTGPKPNPDLDDVDHINTHNRGKSELGRALSSYHVAAFNHPYFGPFQCIEGFWYYMRSGFRDDVFRTCNGFLAKERARETNLDRTTKSRITNNNRDALILSAYHAKIEQHPDIKAALVESTLPFDNYYLHNNVGVPIHPPGAEVVIARCYQLREMFQQDIALEVIDYAKLLK